LGGSKIKSRAATQCRTFEPGLVVTDIIMPDVGIRLVRPKVNMIAMLGNLHLLRLAARNGAHHILPKPFRIGDLNAMEKNAGRKVIQASVRDGETELPESLVTPLESAGFNCRLVASARGLLLDAFPNEGCLIVEIRMRDVNGVARRSAARKKKPGNGWRPLPCAI
jgi:FixJ family two-component response regulator